MKEIFESLFEYKDGKLFNKTTRSPNAIKGQEAGSISHYGYREIRYNGKLYKTHRIIFLMFHGYLPEEIDHINNNRLDNRIENLREATRFQNNCNTKLQLRNKTGYKGVWFDKQRNKYSASIRVNKKTIHLGRFNTAIEAFNVVNKHRDILHKDFANNGNELRRFS